jgi:phospholipase C
VPPFTGRWRPAPPAEQALPAQEPGVRPARPLPYQTDALANLDGDRLKVSLANYGDRSAHFAVYGFAGETAEPVHFDVHGCTDTELALAGDAYDVTVSGPNRFVREFAGTQSGAAGSLLVTSDVPRRARRLTLTLVNCSDATLDVAISPLAYSDDEPRQLRLRPGRERRVTWSTADTEGWYDLEITAAQDPSFRRRLLGHLENGRPSVTG